jgi:hypothetical protein
MRAQNRLPLAVGSLLLVFPVLCGAVTATFEKIADTSTLMPAGLTPDDPFTQLNKLHALGAGTVTFSGRTASRFGMYNRNPPPPFPPPLVPLAQNQLALPPAGTGQYAFDSFSHISADGGQVAFGAALLGGNTGGLAILTGSPGALSIVATAATLMPGYTHNFGSFGDISLRSGQIVWRSQSQFGSGETGVYSSSGGIHAVALPGDAVPGLAGGTFTALNNFPTVVTDGSDIVFYANSSSSSVFSHNGIYKSSGGILSMVVDSNTPRPGAPLEKFSGPYRLAMDQGVIAFAGDWADLTAFPVVRTSGVYTISGGVHTVADTSTVAPGIGVPFTLFADDDGGDGGGVAIRDDVIAFVAYTGPPGGNRVAGIYVSSGGGPAKKLLAEGDFFDGKTITDLSIRRESLDANPKGGYSLVFSVFFTDFSQAIYRADFGAPVRQAIGGLSSIAVLRQGSILIEMRNPLDGTPVGTLSFLSNDYVPISAAALPDSDGNGVAELAVLAERISDGRAIVQVRNISGVAAPRNIWFAADSNPIAMSVITSDADNNGVVEIAVLSTRNSDGRGRVEIKNAFGAVNTQTVYTSAGLTPRDLDVVEDSDGNGVPEVATLSTRNSDGRTVVGVANANGALNRHSVYFKPNFTAVDLAIVNDADGDGIPEIAVLSSRNSDGRAAVEIRNAAGVPNPVTRWLARGYTPLAVAAAADADGNSVPEVAALSSRDSDGRIAVDVSNAAGDAGLNRIFYSPGFSARSLVILDDLDGNSVPEAAVVMIRDTDGRILVQRRNAAGIPTATNYFLAP